MKPDLKLVSENLPDPPFPPDMRAQGWRFDLDYERIETSDTWALARHDLKPWLLMLWFKAWQQTPIGSLPNDDEIIAAKIGMDFTLFQAYRPVLMRGWRLHSDGRFYHAVITETANRMIDTNRKKAEKQQAYRDRKKALLSRNDNVTVTSRSSSAPAPAPAPDKESASRSSIGKPILAAAAAAPPAKASPKDKTSPCPYEEIRQLWAKNFPYLAQPYEPEKWSDQRRKQVRERWKEQPDLEWWDSFLEYLTRSDFLMGRKNGRDFQITFDWLIKPANWVKCQEGNYHG